MYRKNLGMWCCALLFVISFAKPQQNFTNNNEENLMMGHELNANSTINYGNQTEKLTYNLHKNFYKNIQDKDCGTNSTCDDDEDDKSKQYELGTYSMQNEIDKRIIPRTDSIKVDSKENFMPQKIYENSTRLEDENDLSYELLQNSSEDNNENDMIVTYKICSNKTCIQLCCPFGDRLIDEKCVPGENKYSLPNVYEYENKRVDEFQLVVCDPCQKERFLLPEDYNDFMIFANGSIYLYYYKIFVKSTSYCLAVINEDVKFVMTICSETTDEIFNIVAPNSTLSMELNKINFITMSFHIVSLICLLPIFFIYSILPELRNVHGFMLRNYSGTLAIAYAIDMVNIIIRTNAVQDSVCITIAFLIYFCFLASSFWLNVMSFDMWWTFRIFCSLRRNMKQQQQRRKLFYAIYAWGIPFILAIVCSIMDFIPGVPKSFRPKFRSEGCWFGGEDMIAYILYYYGLKSVCVISSICLSISTALKIVRYKKDTSYRLKDSESKCYNDNKKWFNLYLKLFIVLFITIGIKWLIITASLLSGNVSIYNSYAINLMDITQNLCAFIIFVWKNKIKHMLLKRFGCGLFLEARYRTNTTSSSNTMSNEIAMQEMSSSGQARSRTKTLPDKTDL